MGRFTPIKVNYVAFYFRDWIVATSIMSTIERGIYSSLVFAIYEAGGRLEHKTALLASISGLTELEFSTHWSKLKSKFVQEGNYLYHKRCTLELKKTFKLTEAGRKGAEKRWKTGKNVGVIHNIEAQGGFKGVNSPPLLRNETNTKQNNNKTNTSINPIFKKTLDSIKVSGSFLKSSSLSDSSR
jgi:uncharacterized protein YdaU (DUF1376 family)